MRKIYKRGMLEDWKASVFLLGSNISATLVSFSVISGHGAYSLPLVLIAFSVSAVFLRGRMTLVLFDNKEVVLWSAVNLGLLASAVGMNW
jgi:hypothetical protein